jgi:hypothetical protein
MRSGNVAIQWMLVSVFISVSGCHCLVCGGAQTETMTVLNASVLPQQQGWSVSTNAEPPLDIVTDGSRLTLNTIGVPRSYDQLPGKAFMWFYREVPFNFNAGFSIEFTLKVHETEQPHNLFDAGIMIYGSTDPSGGTFVGGPRNQMIFFDEDAIGWGDETEVFAMDTMDTFHTYTLTVDDNGAAKVYVDGTLALQRNNWVGIPGIGFGDMTNDDGVNGKFSIGDIMVTGSKAWGFFGR